MASAGLKKFGKAHKTETIAKKLEGKPRIDDPEALAVWIRKQGLGEAEFKRHQKAARKK